MNIFRSRGNGISGENGRDFRNPDVVLAIKDRISYRGHLLREQQRQVCPGQPCSPVSPVNLKGSDGDNVGVDEIQHRAR